MKKDDWRTLSYKNTHMPIICNKFLGSLSTFNWNQRKKTKWKQTLPTFSFQLAFLISYFFEKLGNFFHINKCNMDSGNTLEKCCYHVGMILLYNTVYYSGIYSLFLKHFNLLTYFRVFFNLISIQVVTHSHLQSSMRFCLISKCFQKFIQIVFSHFYLCC